MRPGGLRNSYVDTDYVHDHVLRAIGETPAGDGVELLDQLKHFGVVITAPEPVEGAIVTSGGVSVKEVDPRTMESKKTRGLYLAGELLDVDAYTGGFNLQIAYSTGYTSGMIS